MGDKFTIEVEVPAGPDCDGCIFIHDTGEWYVKGTQFCLLFQREVHDSLKLWDCLDKCNGR